MTTTEESRLMGIMQADADLHATLIAAMDQTPDSPSRGGDTHIEAPPLLLASVGRTDLADQVVRAAVAAAVSQLGVTEADYVPDRAIGETPGKNKTQYHRWLYPSVNRQSGEGWQWCALFAAGWCYWSAGVDLRKVVAFLPSCSSVIATARKYGAWHTTGTPRAGDLILYGDSRDTGQHVGISETGGYQHSIEGNTTSGNAGVQSNGGGVFRRRRGTRSNWVTGYVDMRALLVALDEAGRISLSRAAEARKANWRWQPPKPIVVSDVQRAVRVTVDGIYGPGTRDAVAAMQTKIGTEADGKWGLKTAAAYEVWRQGGTTIPKPPTPPKDGDMELTSEQMDRLRREIVTGPAMPPPSDPTSKDRTHSLSAWLEALGAKLDANAARLDAITARLDAMEVGQ